MLEKEKSKLTGIYLENFQSLRSKPLFLKFDKLTLLYGPNSAGKSAIIDALNLLKITVNNTDDWVLRRLYEDQESAYQYNKSKIGAEIVIGNFDWTGKQSEWYNSKDTNNDYDHQFIFDNLIGKKIQIEFSNGGESVRVACEGIPAFEILDEYTPYNLAYQKLSEDEKSELNNDPDYDPYDSTVQGKLIIYKKSALFEKVYSFCCGDIGEREKSSYFYDLIFEEYEDKLVVNGIQFNAQNQSDFLVSSDGGITRLLNKVHEDSTDEFENNFNQFLKDRLLKIKGPNEAEERLKEFDSQLDSARNLRNFLIKLADEYSKLLKGFFYQVENALNYSHVRGDRGILNSNDCVSYEKYKRRPLQLSGDYRDGGDSVRVYADYLSKGFSWWISANDVSFKGDFVNHCFQKLLPSLKGYEIVCRTYDLTLRGEERPDNTLVYLDIKDKSGITLGFQDVGSGISYILPIITSLWCKKLFLIEQPELHLHPKAQCELADVFIASLHLGNAAVIESHSEHLLLRLCRRIRETTNGYLLPKELKLTPEDVNIYYFDPQPNGSTSVKRLRLDKHGELMDHWPGGFFSERGKELFGE